MVFLNYFKDTAAVGSGVEIDLPNVAYLEDENVVFSHGLDGKTTIRIDSSTGKIYRDYASEYFTFEALEDGTFTLTIGSAITTTLLSSVSYSLDNGTTWITTNNADSQTVTITTPSVAKGDKVLWKGSGTGISTTTNNSNRTATSSVFSSTCKFNAYGNIMSLLYNDNFAIQTAVTGTYNFALIFYTNNKIVDASKLILPIKNVPDYCFFRAFQQTVSLEYAPDLLGETVGKQAYTSMFVGCNSLTETAKMMATSVGENCCATMYMMSPNLKKINPLPATTLGDYCYYGMFSGCTGLSTVSLTLPTTTLSEYCYAAMFIGCSSLTTAPALPATTLAESCYDQMFQGCTSLTTAPELPVTTLADYCYNQMFWGCTNLTTAPALPATTLAKGCYGNMFRGCASLTTAPALPATTLTSDCYKSMFHTCTNLTTAPALPATTLATCYYAFMFNGYTSLTTTPALSATTLTESCYQDMFNGCTSLTTVSEIAATSITGDWACYQMFYNCISLRNAPFEFAVTTTPNSSNSNGVCTRMFANCTSLKVAPVIRTTTLGTYSFKEMFSGCTSLNEITCYATNISASGCTENWVGGVAATGTFKKNASMSSWTTGVNGIPASWTVQNAP